MKKKTIVIGSAVIAIMLAIVLFTTIIMPSMKNKTPTDKAGNTSDTVSDNTLNIDEIDVADNNSTSSDDNNYLEPDETEADKLLEEKNKKAESQPESKPAQIASEPKPVQKPANPVSSTTPTDSKPQAASGNEENKHYNEEKKELEKKAADYLKTHNIDKKTAGETGEICSRCGKKIWNPDKYGLFIPGMPEDYENSGYCLGTCGIAIY